MVQQRSKYAPARDLQYDCQMHAMGYLTALITRKLISVPVYEPLSAELDTACTDTIAEQAAKAG